MPVTSQNEAVALREAVDALTQPTYTKVTQAIDGAEHVVRVRHDPLLTQLDDAIRGAMSATAGGNASSPSTRSLVNSDALYQLTVIGSTIIEWSRLAGAPRRRDALSGLRAWHAEILAQDIDRAWYARVMRQWAVTIRAIVNPPTVLELEGPCPVCEATVWEDTAGGSGVFPLVQSWSPESPTSSAMVRCRACGARWVGVAAMEELAEELNDREERTA